MAKKDPLFTLDREGGREKISRAMYSPQQYRRENTKQGSRRKKPLVIAVLLGLMLAYILQLLD